MPIKGEARDRKIMVGALCLLVVLLLLALALPRDENETQIPSSYSATSGGAKAAYLLLENSAYQVERWTLPPQQLPKNAEGTVLVLAAPTDVPTETERAALVDFVKRGGRILAVGPAAQQIVAQKKEDAHTHFRFAMTSYNAVAPGRTAQSAPAISMERAWRWHASGGELPLYGDDQGVVVTRMRLGGGEIINWASPTPMTNAGLRNPGSVELLLNSIGEPGTRVLWDEYFHGLQQGVGHLLGRTPLKWGLLQCMAILLAAMLAYSRRNGPLFQPVEPSRLSPMEYVETLGSLYRRARAGDVVVAAALDRFRMLAARKLGVRSNASPERIYEAVRGRRGFRDDGLVSTLYDCEGAAHNRDLGAGEALRLSRELQRYIAELKLDQ